jgi:Ca2+-binding EF-hand superfamily protein
MFSRYDADKDGKLSKSEVPAEMWEKLSKADENADGLVSEKELEGVYRRPGDGPGKPAEKRPEPGSASA